MMFVPRAPPTPTGMYVCMHEHASKNPIRMHAASLTYGDTTWGGLQDRSRVDRLAVGLASFSFFDSFGCTSMNVGRIASSTKVSGLSQSPSSMIGGEVRQPVRSFMSPTVANADQLIAALFVASANGSGSHRILRRRV